MPSVVRLVCLVGLTTLLTACGGGGDDAVEEAGGRPNSFPGNKNPADGFSESSTGDSSNANGLDKNQVRITVEVPAVLAPGAPLSRRNLRLVQPDSISVYRTNQTLSKISSVDTERGVDDDGFDVIEFPDGQPVGPDVLIEIGYNGARIRAFATDRDRDIKVNPFSEYLVRNALGQYSGDQFEAVMECVNSSDDALCINKYVWSTLADQVQDFEIDIPDGNDLNSAVALLEDRADFASYVNDMAELALVPPNQTGVISAQSVNMNTVFFGLELGRSSRFSDDPASQWGTRRGYEEKLESSGTAYIYPGLSMASLEAFGISVTSMASDIPYERATLTRFPTGAIDVRGRQFWGINGHATSASAASIENQTRLLTGQSLYQSISDKGSAQPVGWTRNPFFLDAYLQLWGNDPNALLASYFTGGKAITLEASSDGYERGDQLEEHFVSVFDVSLTKTDVKNEGNFQVSTLADNYNIVSFSAQLGDSVTPFRAESLVGTWANTGITGEYDQQADALEINRSPNGAVGSAASPVGDTAAIGSTTSQTSAGAEENGRLILDFSGVSGSVRPQDGIGASNPDGSIVAFNLDNPAHGDGILIAMEQSTNPPDIANYRLQGALAGLGPDTNYLRHIKDGQLSFRSGTDASVSLAGFQVEQGISTGDLSPPFSKANDEIAFTYTQDTATTGRLSFNSGSGNVTMDGFLSSDGEYLVLRVRETTGSGEQYLGLVLGTLQK